MYKHLHRLLRAAPKGNVTIDSHKPRTAHGFTIVELLVAIVVIGILAAITIVAYTGISQKAIASSLQSDLSNAATQLELYQIEHGNYPSGLDGSNCPTGPADTKYCLKASPGNAFAQYSVNASAAPHAFGLSAANGNATYRVTSSTSSIPCAPGFVVVPGSTTYGTNAFCVMKYGAKNVGGVATSQAALTPWVIIPQTGAGSATELSTAACTGCHLITEAEWLTIAQNVLSVASNWNGGVVGSGYIYSGHNDSAPNNALAADSSDANGYAGETNTGGNQRRTLTLSNGEIIWDLAGNVYEWTSGTSTTGQPGITGTGGSWREWTAITNPGTISPNPSASATGITGASSWNSGNGIGLIWSNTEESGLHGFVRGGRWNAGGYDGVLTLNLGNAPSYTDSNIGFRVSR